jgi:myo-inositol-1(or 4)-monophosphatase
MARWVGSGNWYVVRVGPIFRWRPCGAAREGYRYTLARDNERMEARELAGIALEAARRAVAVHREHAGRVELAEWAEKGASDYVTRVDHEAETRMVDHLRACCPDHDIMAEESTELGDAAGVRSRFEASEYLWILDPLDGTTNFLHGYPAYAASAAVAHRGEVVAGAVVDGVTGTAWWSWRGGGAWRDGERVRVSPIERLDRALIGTGFPFKVLDRLPAYLRQFDAILRSTSGIRRAGSAALDLCHVADGRFEGFWELWLAPWDIAAGTLVVREAGGVVTGLEGGEDVRAGGAIVAGNPAVHGCLVALLAGLASAEGS